ncbi:YcaO-like family protein [Virgibacillus salexigens]|uniref:YcaO-like family protein n=1 Tax=Virgibacillus salexigens TaxID=61016 RepID=UPI00190AFE24|nr:YcaO-like family protein [Virgibacillus salexigens]
MKCIIKDMNNCIIMAKNENHQIECADSVLFKKIFDSITEGNVELATDELLFQEEVKEFIGSLDTETKDTETNPKMNYLQIDKENKLNSKNRAIMYSNDQSVIHIKNCSINYLKNKFIDKNMKNNIFVFELFNDFIISGYNSCLYCLIERYKESIDNILKINNMEYELTNTSSSKQQVGYIKAIANYKLKNKMKNIDIINKRNLSEINTFPIINMNNCTFCSNKNKVMHSINLSLSNENNGKNYRYLNVDMAWNELEKYVNRVGPVNQLNDLSNLDSLNFHVYESISNCSIDEVEYSIHGGKGVDQSSALVSAVGEALERYNARMFGNEEIIVGSFNSLNKSFTVLNPKSLIIDNNLLDKYDNNNEYEWILSKDISTNNNILMPANTVFFPYYPKQKNHLLISQSSTGLASGFTIEEAILSGIFEVLERDAYTIYHKNRLYYGEIPEEVYFQKLKRLISKLKEENIQPIIHYLKTDLNVHIVHCTLFDTKNNFPIYTHGSNCSLDIISAIEGAILEAIQLRTSQISLKYLNQEHIDQEYKAYIEWGRGNIRYVKPFLNKTNPNYIVDFNDYRTGSIYSNIKYLVTNLSELGYKVIVADLSRSDNKLKTVKVVIPGFQDIDDFNLRLSDRMYLIPDYLRMKKEVNNLPMFS